MEDRIDLARDLTLVLFGVSMAWNVYSSMDHYPCINRFGHVLEKNPWKDKRKDLFVLLLSWLVLGVTVGLSLYSIFFTFKKLEPNSGLDAGTSPWLIPTLGVIASYYIYVPYLANRLLIALALVVAPDDFKKMLDDPISVRYHILPRISLHTIRIWASNPYVAGGLIALNSGLLLAFLLIFTPNVTVTYIDTPGWLFFFAAVLIGLASLLLQIPYGCLIKPTKEADEIVKKIRKMFVAAR